MNPHRRGDPGMVTAELATIAPFGVAFAFLLLWVVSLGFTQIPFFSGIGARTMTSTSVAAQESP